MGKISSITKARKAISSADSPRSVEELRQALSDQAVALADFAVSSSQQDGATFKSFENALVPRVFELARTVLVLFLVACEEHVRARTAERVELDGRRFRRADPQPRNLNTWFGTVRYWRTYLREVASNKRRGFHPLDAALGLGADKTSFHLLGFAARLATKMSFADARAVLGWFVPEPPSTEVIENTVLGLGRHTAEWFESAPAPADDGEVLVIQFDGKAAPTATAEELKRRRGKRRKRGRAASPRHRGRRKRGRYPKKPPREKGDKSKNGRVATMVVMYTLRRKGKKLLGPINRWVYGSFAPKEHAFVIAQREAEKRGFSKESGRLVQVVTDGDNDLARYTAKYFPNATHTVDIMHVLEKLHEAATCIFRDSDEAKDAWFEEQKDALYEGKAADIVADLCTRLESTPRTGPGNKGKRERLADIIHYLTKRRENMNYDELIELDLEIGSGAVEGVVKNVIGKRCDHGGMRWIPERAEAVVQLRCIELNGDWEAFTQFVYDKTRARSLERGERVRLQQRHAAPLPRLPEAA